MKRLLLLVMVAFVALIGWRISESISSDALGLAIGVVFGVLAGLPTALLVLASNRRRQSDEVAQRNPQPYGQVGYGPQAPVIVLASPGMHPQHLLAEPTGAEAPPTTQSPWPEGRRERQFQFIGEEQESEFGG
jgi:hypothetical protein